MGINVRLEGERGWDDVLEDLGPHRVLYTISPRWDDTTFSCLRFIDPYGMTIFNRQQCKVLIDEIHRQRAVLALEADGERWLDDLERLVQRAATDVHLYVRFVGD